MAGNILRKPRPTTHKPVPFGVSVRKAGRRVLLPAAAPTNVLLTEPEEQPGTIQGQRVTNLYEWRLAKAILSIGLDFDYQVSVSGGRALRGGQVIDFVVHTVPLFTPVFADGEHWHEGQLAREDSYKRAFLNAEMATTWNPWVAFFGPELRSQEAANRAVREKLV